MTTAVDSADMSLILKLIGNRTRLSAPDPDASDNKFAEWLMVLTMNLGYLGCSDTIDAATEGKDETPPTSRRRRPKHAS